MIQVALRFRKSLSISSWEATEEQEVTCQVIAQHRGEECASVRGSSTSGAVLSIPLRAVSRELFRCERLVAVMWERCVESTLLLAMLDRDLAVERRERSV